MTSHRKHEMAEGRRTPATVILLLMSLWNNFQGTLPATGRSFVLVFPRNKDAVPSVVITAVAGQSVQVTVTVRDVNASYVIGGHSPHSRNIRLPDELVMDDSQKYGNSCVRVSAPADILVHGMTVHSLVGRSKSTSAAYLVLPLSRLSTRYVTLTYCPRRACVVAIASVHDQTSVALTLSLHEDQEVVYRGQEYANGDQIHETLQDNESMQVLGVETDMTGSTVTSDKPVAVISGGDFIRLQGTRSDAMMEMMPPVDSLGREYIVPSFPGPLNGTWLFIVSTEPRTRIQINSTNVRTEEHGTKKVILRLPVHSAFRLLSNRPVLVATSPPSSDDSRDSFFDPTLTLLMPVGRWTSCYVLPSLRVAWSKHLYRSTVLVLYADSDCHGPVYLNASDVTEAFDWTNGTSFQVASMTYTEAGPASLHWPSCRFGGYLAISYSKWAVSVPLGWDDQPIPLNTNGTSDVISCSMPSIESKPCSEVPPATSSLPNYYPNTMVTHSSMETDISTQDIFTDISTQDIFTDITTPPTALDNSYFSTLLVRPSQTTSSRVESITDFLLTGSTFSISDSEHRSTTVHSTTSQTIASTSIVETSVWTMESSHISPSYPYPSSFTSSINIATRQTSSSPSSTFVNLTPTSSSSFSSSSGTASSSSAQPTLPYTSAPETTTAIVSKPLQNTGGYTELVLCPCTCSNRSASISRDEFQKKVMMKKMEVKKTLAVNRTQLSASVRRKTSALELKPSSTAIGTVVAGGVFTVVALLIVLPDLLSVYVFIYDVYQRCL